MRQFLKSTGRAARTWVIAPKPLKQPFVSAHDAIPLPDSRLRREALSTFTRDLERTRRRGGRFLFSWRTSRLPPTHAVGDRILVAAQVKRKDACVRGIADR